MILIIGDQRADDTKQERSRLISCDAQLMLIWKSSFMIIQMTVMMMMMMMVMTMILCDLEHHDDDDKHFKGDDAEDGK